MMVRNVLVGDDGNPGAGAQLRDALAERGKLAAADDDVIAAIAERNVNDDWIAASQRRGHDTVSPGVDASGAAPRGSGPAVSTATISSTILSCGTSRDCTVKSASR